MQKHRRVFSFASLKDFFLQALDQIKLGGIGISYLLSFKKYLLLFLFSWLFFLYFLNFFKDGSGNLALLFSGISIEQKLSLLWRVLLSCFSSFISLYGLSLVLLSLLQGLAIALTVYAWRHKSKDQALSTASTSTVASALGFVALGCPSCGSSLLKTVLSALAGASASILAEKVGIFLTILAFILLFYSVFHLGYLVFILVSAKKYKEKHAPKSH